MKGSWYPRQHFEYLKYPLPLLCKEIVEKSCGVWKPLYGRLMETTQSIYSRLKLICSAGDKSGLWAFSTEFHSLGHKYEKLKAESEVKDASGVQIDFNDKEAVKGKVLDHLFAESAKGNAQASDKLAKLAGLGESEQDIIIEIVSYADYKRGEEAKDGKGTQEASVGGEREGGVEQLGRDIWEEAAKPDGGEPVKKKASSKAPRKKAPVKKKAAKAKAKPRAKPKKETQ